MLPSIGFTASHVLDAANASTILGAGPDDSGTATSIAAPRFHGGVLHYRREAAISRLDAAGANYQQVLLTAFAQVVDAQRRA
nr:hypothetical protein [uncultured Cupriavidus sp.]